METAADLDPRLALVAAVLALGSEPAGLDLCRRFVTEAVGLGGHGAAANDSGRPLPQGVIAALKGIATGLMMAADHADFLAEAVTELPPAG